VKPNDAVEVILKDAWTPTTVDKLKAGDIIVIRAAGDFQHVIVFAMVTRNADGSIDYKHTLLVDKNESRAVDRPRPWDRDLLPPEKLHGALFTPKPKPGAK
jgi:hypothetical protein